MKKTKIVCTIGPASDNEDTLTKMAAAGMDVARLNFSHGTHEEHKKKIELIKTIREKLKIPLSIMLDTKGPEYRIKCFKEGKILLKEGDNFCFTTNDELGDETHVCVSYKGMVDELSVGDKILLNNGLMSFEVTKLDKQNAICKVTSGGELSDRKSMSFPNKHFKQVYLSEQDKKDLLFGIENSVDFIACSFVSCKQDLVDVRNFLNANGNYDIDLIAKIENRAGVDNIEEILEVSDGVLIGRGDMGVEIPFEELPAIQKHLIQTCRMLGKRVITATEMLESMIYNPRPTRAEISDVANAVYDGTSAIMLSGETAVGKYPVESVATMSKIALETEKNIDYKKRLIKTDFKIKNNIDAISHSTCVVANDIDAKLIVVCTRTGGTARMVSRFRPHMNILGMTTNERVWRKLSLSWGVIPTLSEEFTSTDVLFYHAKRAAKNIANVKAGDNIVITAGSPEGGTGNTNLIKIERI
jgi:pyruvate kinase